MPQNNSRNKLWLAAAAVLAIAGTGYWWLNRSSHADVAPAAGGAQGMPVEGLAARVGTLEETLTVVGQLTANQGVVLRPEITGRVAAIPYKEGTPVNKGELLIKLDDSVQQAQLAQAEATLNLSVNNLARAGRLVAEGAASKQQVESAEADANLARANVQLARANLLKTRLTAPFAGIAGIRQVNVGDYVTPGQDMVTVIQNDSLRATFRLPEQDALRMSSDATVTILTDEGATIEAKVNAIDGRIDPATRTREVQVRVTDPSTTLVSGQFIRVRVPLQAVQNAVIVPVQALVPMGNKIFAFTVNPAAGPDAPAMASRTEVTVGLRGQNEVQIKSGIQGGQTVVTAGQQKLQAPSMPVTVLSPTHIEVGEQPVENLSTSAE